MHIQSESLGVKNLVQEGFYGWDKQVVIVKDGLAAIPTDAFDY